MADVLSCSVVEEMGVRSEQFLDGRADAHFGESGPGYDRDPLDQNLPDNVSRVNP